ncbi:MAG: hypothetical protein ACPGQL_07960 [Thermoplasmatota archaeon]
MRRAAVLVLLLLSTALPVADAHTQGIREHYDRLLYDCSHDWGWEGGFPLTRGHELVTLDVSERDHDGVPMVFFEINSVKAEATGHGSSYDIWEELRFETPRTSVATRIETTAEQEGEPALYKSGVVPAHLSPMRYGLSSGGVEDDGLLAYEIGYTYDQLKLEAGESITGMEVEGYYRDTFGNVQAADYMAGGYTEDGSFVAGCRGAPGNDPAQDQHHFDVGSWVLDDSDWIAPAGSPPVADITGSERRQGAGPVTLGSDVSDPDGDAITGFAWSVTGPAPATVSPAGGSATITFDQVGVYDVTLVATDATGLDSAPAVHQVTVDDALLVSGRIAQKPTLTSEGILDVTAFYSGVPGTPPAQVEGTLEIQYRPLVGGAIVLATIPVTGSGAFSVDLPFDVGLLNLPGGHTAVVELQADSHPLAPEAGVERGVGRATYQVTGL